MTDPTRPPEDDAARYEREPGRPRWMIIAGIVVAVVILMLVAVMLIGGGAHPRPSH